ncbi:MAG TPA: cytochrome c oxidase accessory protein CcoG [Rudaea sp.]|nr:cytochrome c oxidase accessory protein CcoG [Rudaea sp.]
MKRIAALLVPVEGESLYAAQPKVYPREIDGRFARLRTSAVFALLGVFYAFPWLRWNGHQAVLFDLPARKFYVLGLTFWPQDFFWLAWLLMIAGLSLFFFTALAGRLWCGYACPQTVWTEVFLWIERLCEGRRNQRIKLDASAWTREKLLRKTSKQALWILFSLWTGFTFVGFFTPIAELGRAAAGLSLSGWETFWIVFYGFATYGNAGYLREQVCKYMCPYARFQSAMFDRDTLIVSYDGARGEPRGARRRSVDPRALGLGDCVDCDACVQVCPTGIDIRDGLQIECIACASCIDACDAVMDKMGYARGLVRYTTDNMLGGNPQRVLRPRIVLYGTLLASLVATFAWGVAHRAPLIVEVLRDRNALYRETAEGAIENSYTLKLVNKTDRAQQLALATAPGAAADIVGSPSTTVGAGEVANVPLTLRAHRDAARGMHAVTLVVSGGDDIRATPIAQFFVPEPK